LSSGTLRLAKMTRKTNRLSRLRLFSMR